MSDGHPRKPLVPRTDSGAFQMPSEYAAGPLPSIRPANDEDRIAQIAITANAALQQVTALTARVDGMTSGIESQIQHSVQGAIKVEIAPLIQRIDSQDVAASNLGDNVTELLKIARDRQRREQRESLEEIKMSSAEQKVFSGKGREIRMWIKIAVVVVGLLTTLGTAAGLSQCKNLKAPAAEEK